MKKMFFLLLLARFGAFWAVNGYGQVSGGLFSLPSSNPTPEPSVVTFGASLNGAKAIFPNNSPFIATASASALFPFPVPPYSYTFYARVDFPISQLTNNPNILPDYPSIQEEDGTLVVDPYCPPAECGFILSPPSPPYYPICKGCVYPPYIPTYYEGRFAVTAEQVAALEKGRWYVNVTFATKDGIPLPDYTIRGQILPIDSDQDGVPDFLDECPNTPTGAVVDAHGCSIAQLCPCDGPWKNHGEYLECVKDVSGHFHRAGLITENERRAILHEAEHSDCGQKPPTEARHSGIAGQALIVACPVSPCPPQPFRTTFSVYSNTGHLIETVTTDEQGFFLVHLKPGTYTIVPWTSADCFHAPCADPQTVTVENKKLTMVEIGYVVFLE